MTWKKLVDVIKKKTCPEDIAAVYFPFPAETPGVLFVGGIQEMSDHGPIIAIEGVAVPKCRITDR